VRYFYNVFAALLICFGTTQAASISECVEKLCREGRHREAEVIARNRVASVHNSHRHHPNHAANLHNLGLICAAQGKPNEAEQHYREALAIDLAHATPPHPDTAITLSTLAAICREDGRCGEAESLLKDALRIRELVQGSDHPWTAAVLVNLAAVLDMQGREREATQARERALKIFQSTVVNPSSTEVADWLPTPVFRHTPD
jgi:tetratricopeptide (TPR) repeat protein